MEKSRAQFPQTHTIFERCAGIMARAIVHTRDVFPTLADFSLTRARAQHMNCVESPSMWCLYDIVRRIVGSRFRRTET